VIKPGLIKIGDGTIGQNQENKVLAGVVLVGNCKPEKIIYKFEYY